MNKNKDARWKGAGMGDYYCSLCCETISGNRERTCPACHATMYTDEEWADKLKEWALEDGVEEPEHARTIAQLCKEYGHTQTSLAKRFGIPLRTIQNWHSEVRTPPPYLVAMMEELLKLDTFYSKVVQHSPDHLVQSAILVLEPLDRKD